MSTKITANGVRTNGNGVPRGWHRFSPSGSAHYYGKRKTLSMKKWSNGEWQVWDAERRETIAKGKTMVECHEKVLAWIAEEDD